MSNPQGETATMNSEAVKIEKKKHHHWWQDVPRRLSLTRNRSNSECSESSPATSPSGSAPTGKQEERARRFSETSAHSYEKTSEVRERWNRNYNIPPECFVPPWI